MGCGSVHRGVYVCREFRERHKWRLQEVEETLGLGTSWPIPQLHPVYTQISFISCLKFMCEVGMSDSDQELVLSSKRYEHTGLIMRSMLRNVSWEYYHVRWEGKSADFQHPEPDRSSNLVIMTVIFSLASLRYNWDMTSVCLQRGSWC